MLLHTIRRRLNDERGFTLIELLVVILIIGILAAIAIPSFLNQKDKANDAAAKSYVRNMQTADETYFTDNNAYAPDLTALTAIESSLAQYPSGSASDVTVTASSTGFRVSAKSRGTSGVTYSITKTGSTVTRDCDRPNVGGCSAASTW